MNELELELVFLRGVKFWFLDERFVRVLNCDWVDVGEVIFDVLLL